MVTVIIATHRPKNQTAKVAKTCKSLLQQMGEAVKVLSMENLPDNFLFADSFGQRSAAVQELLDATLVPASRLVVISPEYNGSYPGVFKAFVDGTKPALWRGKKAALIGVASGRAGNLRGMDHLTDLFHHLQVEVFSKKVPISMVDHLLDEKELVDSNTVEVLRKQLESFMNF